MWCAVVCMWDRHEIFKNVKYAYMQTLLIVTDVTRLLKSVF
jgi:hypothetical protein